MAFLAKLLLRLLGWRIEGERPPGENKLVVILAPHTANQDYIYWILMAYSFRMRFAWLGKAELFSGPLRWILRRTGGIPVRRGEGMVAAAIHHLKSTPELALAIAPEGQLPYTRYWKTGFYQIALGAGVPILLAFADYRRRIVGLGPLIHPTGDLAADMAFITPFYEQITARFPAKAGPARVPPMEQ